MIKSLHIKNFTVFSDVQLDFSKQLNVFIGENGTGKSHLLKLAYSVLAVGAVNGNHSNTDLPTKSVLNERLASKLVNVFKAEQLGRLATRKQGRSSCEIEMKFDKNTLDIDFSFASQAKSEVKVTDAPRAWNTGTPTFLPTRELLTLYPGFVALYDSRYLEFEETWRDTCVLLGRPLRKGPKDSQTKQLLTLLEEAMGGNVELDKHTGRFYLNIKSGRMEMPLVAEGLRKLAMLAMLVANGSLLEQGYLFWDEPEANLNPKIVKAIAKVISGLASAGIQVFIATHSLFLIREIQILQREKQCDVRYFGLTPSNETQSVAVTSNDSIDNIGPITSLDEELTQADRYLEGDSSV